MWYIVSINSAGSYTTSTVGGSSTTAAGASSIATNNMTTIMSSARNVLSSQLMLPVGINTTLNPGIYYLAQMWSTASTTAGTNLTSTGIILSIVNQYGIYGNTNTAARVWGATAATSVSAPFPGIGAYTATSASPPSVLQFSEIKSYGSMIIPYFNIVNSTI